MRRIINVDSDKNRFNELMKKGRLTNSGCLEWPSPRDKNGYGITSYYSEKKGRTWKVHRLIWLLAKGRIPEGMFVCHKCDNPSCYLLSHLFIGTPKDNSQDRQKKGRSRDQIGEKNHSAILTEKIVLQIRKMHADGMKNCDIARKLNIRQETVSKIVLRTRWKHI